MTAQLLILGMHRSGTSALTGLVEKMGLFVGEPHELLPANPDNPKGFFERRDIIAANQAIMKQAGCNWYTLDKWNIEAPPAMPDALLAPIKQIVTEMNAPNKDWVLKEPRLCLTLPYWLSHLSKPVALITYRDPLEIAQSLFLRNDIPVTQGLALWECYVKSLLHHSANMPKIYCDYDDLITQPFATVKRLHSELTAQGFTLSCPSDADITSFIVPSLKRAVRINHPLTPQQQELVKKMRGA